MLGLRNSSRLTLYMHSNKNLLLLLFHILIVVCVAKSVYAQPATQKTAHRWVIGAGVNLRAEANLNAPVLTRMALNTPVTLIATIPNSKYCEVELTSSVPPVLRGFTACEFLGTSVIKPREVANEYLADGKTPNPNYNPERAFWLKPSYEALAEYGRYLERKRNAPSNEAEGIFLAERPKMPEFERMKEHLAKGALVAAPAPYWRWDELKALALRSDAQTRLEKMTDSRLIFHYLKVPLINAIELPIITSSHFQNQNEIAEPTKLTEKIAAQFQIIQTIKTRNFDTLNKDPQSGFVGIWGIKEITRSLTQPVIKNTLSREGTEIHFEPTYLRQAHREYGDTDGVMCEGYEGDGFDFGDADPKISINYAKNAGHDAYSQPKKAGNRLMYFFTKKPLPQQTASMSVVKQKLNRAKTGFVAATEFHFDINSDGIPDILVWEGTGIGPGHLDGPTKTDDAWYRIFFVNIAGLWHLLGTDSFSYGCGC
jgi:hypothetical protein